MPNQKKTDIPPELREWIDHRVQMEFDRDRTFLRETIVGAVKILGACIAVIAAAFTFLGVKTWWDIDQRIGDAAAKEVQKRLQSDDPMSPFRMKVDDLVDRAVLNAYLVQLAEHRSRRWLNVKVATDDLPRLIRLISNPDTPDHLFLDAVRVALLVDDDRAQTVVRQRLLTIAAAQQDSKWVERQPVKREWLLTALAKANISETIAPATTIIEDPTTLKQWPTLVVSAIDASTKLGADSVTDDFERLAKAPDRRIRIASLKALAHLKPTSKILSDRLSSQRTSDFDDVRTDLELAAALILGKQNLSWMPLVNDATMPMRSAMATQFFERALQTHFIFRDNSLVGGGRGLALYTEGVTGGYGTDDEVLYGPAGRQLVQLVSVAAAKRNLASFNAFVRTVSFPSEVTQGGLRVAFGKDDRATITTVDGDLTRATAPRGVLLRVVDRQVLATWYDALALRREAKVTRVSGADTMSFELAEPREPAQDD